MENGESGIEEENGELSLKSRRMQLQSAINTIAARRIGNEQREKQEEKEVKVTKGKEAQKTIVVVASASHEVASWLAMPRPLSPKPSSTPPPFRQRRRRQRLVDRHFYVDVVRVVIVIVDVVSIDGRRVLIVIVNVSLSMFATSSALSSWQFWCCACQTN